MTLGVAVVIARQDGAADGHDVDSGVFGRALHDVFATTQRRRRKKVAAAGKSIRIVVAAADSDELIDLVVVGCDVFVADRPGDFPTIAFGSGEIEIAVAQADAAPDIGFAAASPDARERKVLSERSDVGLLGGIENEGGRLLTGIQTLLPFPGFDVGPEFAALEFAAGIEHRDVYALAGEVPRGHAAGGAAADDNDVLGILRLA